MKKIMTLMMVMVFVLCTAINVKASSWTDIYNTIEKQGSVSSNIYDTMPTEVRKGDIITVKLIAKNVAGWDLLSGVNFITWDKSAFTLVETNGKNYRVVSDYIIMSRMEVTDGNSAILRYSWKQEDITENNVDFIELDFKVNENVSDGVYKISVIDSDESMQIRVGSDYYSTYTLAKTLKYQVGTSKISSDWTKSDIENIPNDVYIIGSHMFTRTPNLDEDYHGILTTEFIMLGAKSIEGDNKDDMKIYLKNAFGDWKNAITNETITSLPSYPIKYIDMKPNYLRNGIYSDNDYKNILRLIQINETEAIVTIETPIERIHGIGTINDDVVTFNVRGVNYRITIGDNSVTVSPINKTLQKKTNLLLNDYFNETYAMSNYSGLDAVTNYLNSEHTGKYTLGNYEIYLLRIGENTANVCVKQSGQEGCIYEGFVTSNEGYDYTLGSSPTTYAYNHNETFLLDWSNQGLNFTCVTGDCSSYEGTYSKAQSLSMDDVFHLWEKNTIQYAVTFNENNGSETAVMFIPAGSRLIDVTDAYYEPEKNGAVFARWEANGEAFDPTTPITGAITLDAIYRDLPGAPVIPDEPDYTYSHDDNQFTYHIPITLEGDYDGFDIYKEGPVWELVAEDVLKGEEADVVVDTDDQVSLVARAYIMVNNVKHSGAVSNIINLHPEVFTVSFNSKGGTPADSLTIPYNQVVPENDIPEPIKAHFTFLGWYYNNAPFDFANTPITGDITLYAEWENDIATPVIGNDYVGSFYVRDIYVGNLLSSYCSTASGECDGSANDNYYISGYELYEIVDNNEVNVTYSNKTQFAPNEHIELTFEPNVVKNYIMKTYIKEGAETTYSESSTTLQISTMIPAPTIAFDPTAGTQSLSHEVENWIKVSYVDDTYAIPDNCTGSGCDGYRIDGFILYDAAHPNDELQSYSVNDVMAVSASYGENKHYIVKAWAYTSDGEGVLYSPVSNEIILDTAIKAPVISLLKKDNSNEPRPFWYVHESGFSLEVDADYSRHYICPDPNEPDDCDYTVDGYEIFFKDGNSEVSMDDGFMGGVVPLVIPEGTSKTIVARAYVDRPGEPRLYSPDSNEISIDLTNPVYTFETVESQTDANKVYIKAYVNEYETLINGIKVDGVVYTDYSEAEEESNYIIVNKTLVENLDTIEIGLDSVQPSNPNNFIYSVDATRKTN